MRSIATDADGAHSTRRIRARLLAIAWPAMLENSMHSVIFMANTALAGRLGAEALAAAGISNFLMFFSLAVLTGVGVGTLALVAHSVGANDFEAAGSVGRQGVMVGTALSLISVFVLSLFAAPILGLLGADESTVEIAVPYLIVSALFLPFQAIIMMVGSVMRGAGDTRTPMIASLVVAVLDVGVGALLVFDVVGPGGLGLMGIAIALSLARVTACVVILVAAYRSPLRGFVYGRYGIDLDAQRRLWRVSGPAAAEQAITVGGIMAVSIIGLQLGTVSFAAQNVIGPIMSLAFMPSFGLGVAASAAVGQSLGARNAPLARRFGREAALGGTLLSTVVGIVVILFPRELMTVFTSDVAVIDAGEGPVRIVGLFMPALGLATTLPGALRGAGDTRVMLLISLLALWIVRVPLALVLGFWAGFGLAGIWAAAGINYVVLGTVALARFVSGRWLIVSV